MEEKNVYGLGHLLLITFKSVHTTVKWARFPQTCVERGQKKIKLFPTYYILENEGCRCKIA